MIGKLEDELLGVESAQKLLDKYPNLSHPIAPHAAALVKAQTYGPLTSEQVDEEIEKNRLKELGLDRQLFEQFPFLKQAFVGPKTKGQAKAHQEMREIIFDGEFYMDDLEEMMPEENLKAAMEGLSIDPYRKKPGPPPLPPPQPVPGSGPVPGAKRMRKMTYDEIRLEKETAKIAAQFKASGLEPPPQPPKKVIPKMEGPMTREEWIATLPVLGAKTKGEAMLPVQREQRQIILTWLKQPWRVYDEEAAVLMHKLGTLAFGKLEEKAREMKGKKDPRIPQKDKKEANGEKEKKEASGEDEKKKEASGEKEKMEDSVKKEENEIPVFGPAPEPKPKSEAESVVKAENGAEGEAGRTGAEAEAEREEGDLKLEVEVLEGVELVDLAEKVKLD